MKLFALFVAVTLLGTTVAVAELMIPDSGTGDRVMLFSSVDGSLIDANWITDAGAVGWFFTTPKEASVIGSEIWVSDQVADAIHRFDLDRNFLSSITAHPGGGVLDNLRGFGSDGTSVYLTVMPTSTTLRGIAVYDTSGNPTGFFAFNASFFDAEPFMGDLLVSSSTSNDIERHSAEDGTFISNFATDITFPQGVHVLDDDSVITVSTIAAAGIEGVYHFNADQSLRLYINTEAAKLQFGELVPRAAWLLDDNNYLITTSDGVIKYIVETGAFEMVLAAVDAQFIGPISFGTACATPGNINGDASVDGLDVPGFTACVLGQDGGDCDCADLSENGTAGLEDVQLFVDLLVGA